MAHFLQMITVCDPYLGISPILGVRLLSFASSLSSCFFSSSETSLHRIPLHCLPAARKYKDQTWCSKGNPLWDRNRECVGGVKIKYEVWTLLCLSLCSFYVTASKTKPLHHPPSPPPTASFRIHQNGTNWSRGPNFFHRGKYSGNWSKIIGGSVGSPLEIGFEGCGVIIGFVLICPITNTSL